jgi:hypothetical protein
MYIVKMRATRVSNAAFFKHQYITNLQITPETLVMKAAAELTSALKGTILRDAETVEALTKVSKLFHKIAAAKAATSKAISTAPTPPPAEQCHFQGWSPIHPSHR